MSPAEGSPQANRADMAEGSPQANRADTAEGLRRYHLALAGTLAFFASPFVSWWAVLGLPAAAGLSWKRRLLALAVLDTLVAGCLALTLFGGQTPKPAPRPRIGVTMQVPETAGRVVVATVTAASPADVAGVHAGDRILSVDSAPIDTSAHLTEVLGQTAPGASRTLGLERDGVPRDVVVTPSTKLPEPTAAPRGLFERSGERAPSRPWTSALPEIAIAVLIAMFCLIAWRRRVALAGGLWACAAIVLWLGVTRAAATALAGFGPSLGTFFLALLAASGSLGIVGALGWWRTPHTAPPPDAMPAVTAYGRGLFYCFAWGARFAVVIPVLAKRIGVADHSAAEAFGFSPSWGAGALALFMLTAVVVGPLAEELVFRGLLLPWLATWMSPRAALVASSLTFAVGHLYYGASVLLPLLYGIVFGWMRLRTGRLRAGVALHMTMNTLATAAAAWSVARPH